MLDVKRDVARQTGYKVAKQNEYKQEEKKRSLEARATIFFK